MKKLLIAILATTALAVCGCNENYKTAKATNYYRHIEIDTVSIHGKKHEVLFWDYSHKGGMMHSPECWCMKGGEVRDTVNANVGLLDCQTHE